MNLRTASHCGVLLGLVAATALTVTPKASADDFGRVRLELAEKRLDNGLAVFVHEDHHSPIVSVNLWYAVGARQDPPSRNGFAHLVEHLMLQGSRHVPEDAYIKLLEQAGATDRNAATGDDYTKYFETVPSNELELALWLESDRMAFLLDHLDQ